MKEIYTADENRDESQFSKIPDDFPRIIYRGALPGSQPKILMVKYGGKFYVSGDSPPERFDRWAYCEDCAQQLKLKSLESKAGKRSHMTEEEILDQYLIRLLATNWMSPEDCHWTIQRVATLLEWPTPEKISAFLDEGAEK